MKFYSWVSAICWCHTIAARIVAPSWKMDFINDADLINLILLMYLADIDILLRSYWAGTRSINWRFSNIDTKQRKCSIYEYSPWVYVSLKYSFPVVPPLKTFFMDSDVIRVHCSSGNRSYVKESVMRWSLNMGLLHIFLCWLCFSNKATIIAWVTKPLILAC